jgi:hypothetical protein
MNKAVSRHYYACCADHLTFFPKFVPQVGRQEVQRLGVAYAKLAARLDFGGCTFVPSAVHGLSEG